MKNGRIKTEKIIIRVGKYSNISRILTFILVLLSLFQSLETRLFIGLQITPNIRKISITENQFSLIARPLTIGCLCGLCISYLLSYNICECHSAPTHIRIPIAFCRAETPALPQQIT